MLPTTLNTNEVKNSAGTEVEFSRLKTFDRSLIFRQTTETYALPFRLAISHAESGSGINLRRRSLVRFDKKVMSTVDTSLPVVVSAYAVVDIPQGALLASTEVAHVLAALMSFLASLGASTTILYDGTGNGAAALINGDL
jgi:hypothetical protein